MVKVILCSGMKRSGSTWSYNVCREFGVRIARLQKRRLICDYADDSDFLIRSLKKTETQDKTKTLAVIKAHYPNDGTREQVRRRKIWNICMLRDPRDCFASLEQYRPSDDRESINDRISLFRSWLELAQGFSEDGWSLLVRYEDMIAGTREQIRRIGNYLNIDPSEEQLEEILVSTNPQASQAIIDNMVANRTRHSFYLEPLHQGKVYDPVTQLHEDHLNGGVIGRWRKELTPEVQEKVHTAFLPWLTKFGYLDGRDDSGQSLQSNS